MKAPLMTCWKCRTTAPLRAYGAYLSVRVTVCMSVARHDLGWWEFDHERRGHQRAYYACPHCFSTTGIYCRDVVPYLVREVERLHAALEREDRGEINVPYLTPAEIRNYLNTLDAKRAKPTITAAMIADHLIAHVSPEERPIAEEILAPLKTNEIIEPEPLKLETTKAAGPVVDGIRCELCGRPFRRHGGGTWKQIDGTQSKRRFFVCPNHDRSPGIVPETAADLLIAQLREPLEIISHVTGGPPR